MESDQARMTSFAVATVDLAVGPDLDPIVAGPAVNPRFRPCLDRILAGAGVDHAARPHIHRVVSVTGIDEAAGPAVELVVAIRFRKPWRGQAPASGARTPGSPALCRCSRWFFLGGGSAGGRRAIDRNRGQGFGRRFRRRRWCHEIRRRRRFGDPHRLVKGLGCRQ